MKHSHGCLFIFLLLPLLHACNGDIFVDEIKIPLTEATLSGDGDTLTLRFNTSEWQLNNVYGGEMYSSLIFVGNLYTLNGTDMGRSNCFLDDKGKIIVDYPPYELTFIRPNGKELQICLGDNPTKEPLSFTLSVSDKNYFKQEGISLTQQPGSGYAIDRIKYSLKPESVKDEILEDLYLIDFNSSDEPEERTYNLNKNMRRRFRLYCDTEVHLVQTGDEPPTIEVPSADISQELKNGNDRINYFQNIITEIFMDVEPPFICTRTLQPGRTDIIRVAEYQTYSADYTLYLHNVKTGKPRTVQGTIVSKTPTGTIGYRLEYHGSNDK